MATYLRPRTQTGSGQSWVPVHIRSPQGGGWKADGGLSSPACLCELEARAVDEAGLSALLPTLCPFPVESGAQTLASRHTFAISSRKAITWTVTLLSTFAN